MDDYDGDGPKPSDECDGCGNPLAYCDCSADEWDRLNAIKDSDKLAMADARIGRADRLKKEMRGE